MPSALKKAGGTHLAAQKRGQDLGSSSSIPLPELVGRQAAREASPSIAGTQPKGAFDPSAVSRRIDASKSGI